MGGGGLLVVFSALLATPVSRLFLRDDVDLEGVVSVLHWGSLGATLVLFAPPILLLGTIAPIAIRLLSRHGVGRAAGSVFALSTTGSIVGTYLPTLVLVPHLGSRGSILVAGGILLGAAAVGLAVFGRGRGRGLALLLLLGAAAACVAAGRGLVPPNRPAPLLVGGTAALLHETESRYQYLTVRDDVWPQGTERVLTINEGVHTFHSLRVEGKALTGSRYYDAYSVLPFLLDLEPGSPLRLNVVGMACGVNAAQWHHFFSAPYEVRVDGAELDPEIVRLGRRYFDLPGPDATWLRVHALDGRTLLEHLPRSTRYHAIVVDAFANELYVPFHLATREFFSLCAKRLEAGGLVAMNVYAKGADPPHLRAIENTMAAVFGLVLRVPHYTVGGYLLIARQGEEEVDPSQLAPAAIRSRFEGWDGYADWKATPEWEDLLALANVIRRSAVELGRRTPPDPAGRILTDDHAPLAWLTDRFLRESEAERIAAGDTESLALSALRVRQTRLLCLVGFAWSVALFALALVTRHARDAKPPRMV